MESGDMQQQPDLKLRSFLHSVQHLALQHDIGAAHFNQLLTGSWFSATDAFGDHPIEVQCLSILLQARQMLSVNVKPTTAGGAPPPLPNFISVAQGVEVARKLLDMSSEACQIFSFMLRDHSVLKPRACVYRFYAVRLIRSREARPQVALG